MWDGNKKLFGELILGQESLMYVMSDFSMTDLNLDIPYQVISEIDYHKLYDLSAEGVIIKTELGHDNIFIVSDPQVLVRSIKEKLVEMRIGS